MEDCLECPCSRCSNTHDEPKQIEAGLSLRDSCSVRRPAQMCSRRLSCARLIFILESYLQPRKDKDCLCVGQTQHNDSIGRQNAECIIRREESIVLEKKKKLQPHTDPGIGDLSISSRVINECAGEERTWNLLRWR